MNIVEEDVPLTELPFTFIDIADGDWFYDAVKYVFAAGLMQGVGDDEFAPGSTTTRAMLMTILARMDGVDTDGGSSWYEKAMEWAVENGVSDGSNPEGAITREQLATMLWRYLGQPEASGDAVSAFPDASSVSDWAKDAMIWAVENGIINGSDGMLNPQTGATRAEMATMLMRFCEKYTTVV